MLETILVNRQPVFSKMADAWQDAGATFFAVVQGDRTLASWPKRLASDTADLTAPIVVNGVYLGELQVGGIHSEEAGQLLQVESQVIEAMLQQEQELNSVAAVLVDTQDQFWALYQLTQTTRSYLDMEEMLEALLAKSADLMSTESTFIWLELNTGQLLFYQHPVTLLEIDDVTDFLLKLVRSRAGFLCLREVENHPDVNNILMVPVDMRFAKTAVIGMVNKVDGAFTTPDIKLARIIAEYAGAQVENVISYQDSLDKARLRQQMELAERVQSQLFSQELPEVQGMDFWAASKAASHVGGDFYGYYQHPNGCFTFVVGDVSGKGIASALLMAMTLSVTRNRMQRAPALSPGQIIEQVNSELYKDFTRVNMFATVFVGQYDPANGRLVYANAGHSPVIYCPDNDKASLIDADSEPMGILPKTTATERTIFLKPCDVLIVGSDGLYEVHNADEELFGLERLAAAVSSLRAETARELSNKLFDIVHDFNDGHYQDDDRTVLVLKPTR
ncbi:MAG: PP2C family protein-serine/threonine phosphatase [Anaerolineaceae bacterium]|nr:PP2C family protein-serine/threonine phosphatase [Anaerolineaceae bacterium]